MAQVQKGRFTADTSSLGDEVVVFLIGMRINKPWKVRPGGRSSSRCPGC